MKFSIARALSTVHTAKEYVQISRTDWWWTVGFMLCMSLTGLRFPLGYLAIIVILVNRYKANLYDFTIMLMMVVGGYGLTEMNVTYGIRLSYVIVPTGVGALLVIRKPLILKKVLFAYLIFAAALFFFASKSEEVFAVQKRTLFNYLCFAWVGIPLLIFAGRTFEMRKFLERLVPFVVVMAVFYILDTIIFSGDFLLPNCYSGVIGSVSVFWDIHWQPLTLHFVRKWPIGIILVTLIFLPALRIYRLRPWMWILIFTAILLTRTFTLVIALVVAGVLFTGSFKRVVVMALVLAVAAPALYMIDTALPRTTAKWDNHEQSFLRIKSSVDQFVALNGAADEDDVAEFASGRIGQAIPRFEFMDEKGRNLIGLGFLDPVLSDKPKFLIYDEFNDNPFDRWHVATRIEISPLQTIITIGYLGFAILTFFYLYLCWIIRKLQYARYFYSIMFLYGCYGLTDFASFIHPEALVAISTCYAAVILANRAKIPGFSEYGKQQREEQIKPLQNPGTSEVSQ